MSETRKPEPGELKLVVLIDEVQYHAWIPMDRIDGYLDAMEARLDDGVALRSDRLGQMSLRQWVAQRLRMPETAQTTFDDVGGAACLWLGLRHYEGGKELRKGIDDMATTGAVLSVSIGASPGAADGTAWSFMVGADICDGRSALAQHDHGMIRIFGPGTTEGWRGRTIHPKT